MSLLQRCFIICIFPLTVLSYSPALLDYYHYSRFTVAVFFLAVFAGFATFIASEPKKLTLLDLVLLTFTGWSACSIFWAPNLAEAIYTVLRGSILLSVVTLTTLLMLHVRDQFSLFIHFLSRILTAIILIFVIAEGYEVVRDTGFSNKALYDLNVFFGHKSLIAGYLFLLLPFNLLHIRAAKKGFTISILLILLQVVTIIMLQSRTVYLALFLLVASLAIYGVRSPSKSSLKQYKKQIAVGILVSVGALLLLLQQEELRQRLNPTTYLSSQTASERRLVWYKTSLLIKDNPWVGVGSGNWKTEFARHSVEGSYRMQDQDVVFTRAHNDFLEIFAELGVPGVLTYLSIFFIALLYLFRSSATLWSKHCLAAGIIGFFIMSMIDFPRERPEFLIILGLYLSIINLYTDRDTSGFLRGGKLYFVMLLAINLLGIAVGVMRYKAEVSCVKMLQAQVKGDWPALLASSIGARNVLSNLTPAAVPVDFYRGLALYNMGDKENALDAFISANDDHPYHFHTINNMGTIKVESGHFEEALPIFDEAIRINPRFEDALFNKAYCLSQLGQISQALKIVEEVPTESPKKEEFIRQLTKMKKQ